MEDITIPRISLDWQQISDHADENSSIATAYLTNVASWKRSLDPNDPGTQAKLDAVNAQVTLIGQRATLLLNKLTSVVGRLPK